MIELLVLGIVLFIAGVVGVMMYDKHQENLKSKPVVAKVPRPSLMATLKGPFERAAQQREEARQQQEQSQQRMKAAIAAARTKAMASAAASTSKRTMTGQELKDMLEGRRPDLAKQFMSKGSLDTQKILSETETRLKEIEAEIERRLKGYRS